MFYTAYFIKQITFTLCFQVFSLQHISLYIETMNNLRVLSHLPHLVRLNLTRVQARAEGGGAVGA